MQLGALSCGKFPRGSPEEDGGICPPQAPPIGGRFSVSNNEQTKKGKKTMNKKFGFTLAEVLITLAIVGVVAALTIPTLIEKHQKKVVEARLKKFYSVMHQAIKKEESISGEMKYWLPECADGMCYQEWFEEHIKPHLSLLEFKGNGNKISAKFSDGSGFDSYMMTSIGALPVFFCINSSKCDTIHMDGRNSFLFYYDSQKKFETGCEQYSTGKVLEYCKYGNFDNKEVSEGSRRHCCSTLIYRNGWQIDENYPWKATRLP